MKDKGFPEIIEFLLLCKKCQIWTSLFVYQDYHSPIGMNLTKKYGCEPLAFFISL